MLTTKPLEDPQNHNIELISEAPEDQSKCYGNTYVSPEMLWACFNKKTCKYQCYML